MKEVKGKVKDKQIKTKTKYGVMKEVKGKGKDKQIKTKKSME